MGDSLLSEVLLPQTDKEKAIERQTKRIRSLADSFSQSESDALTSLGELLEDIASELEKVTDGQEGDVTVSEDIEKAVGLAKNA